MRIALLAPTTTQWLAGDPGVSQRVHSWAGDFALTPSAQVEVVPLIDSATAKTFDRGNLSNIVSFTTARTFATPEEAQIFALMLDLAPRKGTLVFEAVAPSTSTFVQMADTVINPPARRLTGATLHLTYRATGGAITMMGTGARTATLAPAGADNDIVLTSTNIIHRSARIVIADDTDTLTVTLADGVVTILAGDTRTAAQCIAAVTTAAIPGLTASNAPGNDGSAVIAAVAPVLFTFP
jgi:hypothetical protein